MAAWLPCPTTLACLMLHSSLRLLSGWERRVAVVLIVYLGHHHPRAAFLQSSGVCGAAVCPLSVWSAIVLSS